MAIQQQPASQTTGKKRRLNVFSQETADKTVAHSSDELQLDGYFGKLKKKHKSYFKQVKAAIYEQRFVSAYLSDP